MKLFTNHCNKSEIHQCARSRTLTKWFPGVHEGIHVNMAVSIESLTAIGTSLVHVPQSSHLLSRFRRSVHVAV